MNTILIYVVTPLQTIETYMAFSHHFYRNLFLYTKIFKKRAKNNRFVYFWNKLYFLTLSGEYQYYLETTENKINKKIHESIRNDFDISKQGMLPSCDIFLNNFSLRKFNGFFWSFNDIKKVYL